MNFELAYQISNFLYQEAYLLDHRQYEEWLDLLSDDIVYRMPLRVTTEGKDGANINNDMAYFEESKASLTTRVKRLYTSSAWVESPPTRQRHFVSNVFVEPTADANEFKVRSYFLYKRSRGSDINTEELFGERVDVIRRVENEWKIVSRTIYPDQAVLGVMNLSMFL
ncbi:3-phenylpropionate/cinnamic acid dioxygenase subunit beta [Ammoniphilus sp. YIM 78166]|uniref:3-phenylpropionate/cinnamic acid dioxygenase subunit beta n=1 Tax=Ammoniphilus sp. YIM 78166 TaxID=1644106 RepID=UPI00106F8130|nr:3-phenylpropionate/cinnamic acid dioxygenase subunit beta [Ammoniphilus sp. YIM 78166]